MRSRLKFALKQCFACRRLRRKALERPAPPPLPAVRSTWQPPFTNVGVDHTGHFHVRLENGERAKAYICLFVCTVSRAIHLEVVTSLTATSFLLCLRRLSAAYGTPKVILSDNHRTFVSTENFLNDIQSEPELQDFIAARRIIWHKQTPRAPWSGGHFERLVRTIKVAMAAAISRKLLTVEEFTTVVKESEAIVNNRPLTYQQVDSQDIPLTPSQLIRGRNINLFPAITTPAGDEMDTNRLRHQYVVLSNTLRSFSRRWRDEYLTSLREKHRNTCATDNNYEIKAGEIVLLKMHDLPREDWPLAKVQKTFKDTNGVIRSVAVIAHGEVYRRPLEHLVPLELMCEEATPPGNETETANNDTDSAGGGPSPHPLADMESTIVDSSQHSSQTSTIDDDVNGDVTEENDDVPTHTRGEATQLQGQHHTSTAPHLSPTSTHRPVRGAATRQRELMN